MAMFECNVNSNLNSIEILHNSSGRGTIDKNASKDYKSVFFIEGDGDGTANYCSVAGKVVPHTVISHHDGAYTRVYRADNVKKGERMMCALCIYAIGIT